MKFRSSHDRELMNATLAFDPSIKSELRKFMSMSTDIRHDKMLIKKKSGEYHQVPDPGCWAGHLKNNYKITVLLIRDCDGNWFINGG